MSISPPTAAGNKGNGNSRATVGKPPPFTSSRRLSLPTASNAPSSSPSSTSSTTSPSSPSYTSSPPTPSPLTPSLSVSSHGHSTGQLKAASSSASGSSPTSAATVLLASIHGWITQLALFCTLLFLSPISRSSIAIAIFVPKPKSQLPWFSKYLQNQPCRVVYLAIALTLGWPMYLAFNCSGRKYHRFVSHFAPYSPIFKPQKRLQVVVSDAGVVAGILLLRHLAVGRGVAWFVSMYGMPLLAVNAIIVFFTYLQHTHPALPHYDSSEWDWLRGALITVDRDYGPLNKVFHNITITHVLHHLFPSIPHYHAMEATKAIKPILGQYYHFDSTPVYKALWREAQQCIYVEPDEESEKGVLWFRCQL